jgi:hypothetical protein
MKGLVEYHMGFEKIDEFFGDFSKFTSQILPTQRLFIHFRPLSGGKR